jgi:hypothetical protein
MSVWATKFSGDKTGHANTNIDFKGFIISIAMDDSCGEFDHFFRSDVRVFKNKEDVTKKFFRGSCDHVFVTGDILFNLMKKIERHVKKETNHG